MLKHILLIVLVSILASQCKKGANNNCLKVKIIRVTCASTVVQVLNNNAIGEDGWTDSFSGTPVTYDNVFTINNACDIPSGYQEGDVVFVTIKAPQSSNCAQCKMADWPPDTEYDVLTISYTPCCN